ncbi:TPA: right-handed parallel beta-helix repeat-containing protein [Bacillus paranthracis]
MAEFEKRLPLWNAPGIEPPLDKTDEGWKKSERPPAEYMNFLHYTTFEALKELQENATHIEELAKAERLIDDISTNVRQFGATGDGSNQTDQINKAIAERKSQFISFPAGEYEIDTLTLQNVNEPIYFLGLGEVTLKVKDNYETPHQFDNCKKITFINLKFDGNIINNKSLSDLFHFKSGGDFYFENCQFANTQDDCIYAANVNSITVKDCVFENAQANAIKCVLVNYVNVRHNTFKDIGNYRTPRAGSSVYTQKCKNIDILYNHSVNISDSAYYVDYMRKGTARVIGNTLLGCKKDGIKAQHNSGKVIITENILQEIAADGINAKLNSFEVIIANNQVMDCCLDPEQVGTGSHGGIVVGSSKNVIINANLVKGILYPSMAGIWVSIYDENSKCEYVTVTNNQVFNVSGWGIYFRDVEALVMNGNIVDQCCRSMPEEKAQIYFQNCYGAVSGNTLANKKKENGTCKLLSATEIQLPKSSPTVINFYTNAMLVVTDRTLMNIQTSEQKILSYDEKNKVVTVGNPIELYVPGEENYFSYAIYGITHEPNYQFRFHGEGELTIMANYVKPTRMDFVLDTSNAQFIISPQPLHVMNHFGKERRVQFNNYVNVRPSKPALAERVFDAKLNKGIDFDGTVWRDGNGNPV